MKKLKPILTLMLSGVLAVSLLAGCSGTQEDTPDDAPEAPAVQPSDRKRPVNRQTQPNQKPLLMRQGKRLSCTFPQAGTRKQLPDTSRTRWERTLLKLSRRSRTAMTTLIGRIRTAGSAVSMTTLPSGDGAYGNHGSQLGFL